MKNAGRKKKLTLNKRSIMSLEHEEQGMILGGMVGKVGFSEGDSCTCKSTNYTTQYPPLCAAMPAESATDPCNSNL